MSINFYEEEAPEDEEFGYLTVSGHPNNFYNGDYFFEGMWNGYPHFSTGDSGEGAAHLYYLNTDEDENGYW